MERLKGWQHDQSDTRKPEQKKHSSSLSEAHVSPSEVLWGVTKIVLRNKQLPKGSEYLKASWTVTYLIKCAARHLSADIWYVWSFQSFAAKL